MRRVTSAAPAPEETQEAALEILRSVRRIDIRSRRLVRELFSGSYHAVFKGRGIEFSEVREYVPGDDVRSIDWNVTARMDRPFIKQFHEERERTVVFLVDRSGSSRFGSSQRNFAWVAAETTAVLAFSATVNQDKVGLLLFSDRLEQWVPPRKGRSHVLRIVREVLFHHPAGTETRIGEALERTTRMLRRRSLVFLISDFLQDDQYAHALSIAARKHEIVPVVLIDPREEALPQAGLLGVVDLETGRRRLVDTSDRRVRARFEQEVAARRRRREEAFSGAAVEPVEIRLDADTIAPLVGYFRRRERWRAAGH
jgi:uncharacterized protein (DUF58 family)